MTQEVTVVLVLAALQILVMKGSRLVSPRIYFSSSTLFSERHEVRYGAVLFRLAIPFAAGLLTPLLVTDNELSVAAASGALAWFLVLWPIAWAPDVMLPLPKRRWIVALLLAFWAAFATFPVSGAALTIWVRSVISDDDADWWSAALAQELVLFIPFAGLTFLVSWLAGQQLPYRDNRDESDPADYEEDWEYVPDYGRRSGWTFQDVEWRRSSVGLAIVLTPIVLVAILVALVRGRR